MQDYNVTVVTLEVRLSCLFIGHFLDINWLACASLAQKSTFDVWKKESQPESTVVSSLRTFFLTDSQYVSQRINTIPLLENRSQIFHTGL